MHDIGAIQVLRNAFFLEIVPPHNGNNVEPYTFETLFLGKDNKFVVSLEEGRGGEGRGGRERERGGREGRDDCYTYYSDGTIYTDQQ